MKIVRPTLLALLVLVLALAGCGGGSNDGGNGGAEEPAAPEVEVPEGELSVADAKEQGGTGVTVNGIVYVRLDAWMLCQNLDETIYPAGCVEPTLKITNPQVLSDVKLEEGVGQGGGLLWSRKPVSVTGDVQGDAITVTEVK